jgi:hypothetical protein
MERLKWVVSVVPTIILMAMRSLAYGTGAHEKNTDSKHNMDAQPMKHCNNEVHWSSSLMLSHLR